MSTPRLQAALDELVAAVREDAVASLSALLKGGEGAVRTPLRPRAGAKATKRPKGGKRTPDEIQAQTDALLSAIKKDPGLRIEEISKQIGISTKELQLPTLKLWEAKAIRTTGTRRATKYFPK